MSRKELFTVYQIGLGLLSFIVTGVIYSTSHRIPFSWQTPFLFALLSVPLMIVLLYRRSTISRMSWIRLLISALHIILLLELTLMVWFFSIGAYPPGLFFYVIIFTYIGFVLYFGIQNFLKRDI